MISKVQITQITKALPVETYLSYKEFLGDIFQKIQEFQPRYIFKDFAEQLGYSRENNTIRLVIRGSRILNNKKADQVAHALGLSGKSRQYFILLVRFNNEKIPNNREKLFQQLLEIRKKKAKTLTEDQLEYFSSWYNPIIREMMALSSIDTSPESIQNNLTFSLRLGEIKKSIELLERIGAIKYDRKRKRLLPSRETLETEQDLENMSIIRYHQKMIEMGRESITQVDPDQRSITGLTLCIPEELIPTMKDKIDKLLDEFVELEADIPSSRIYQVNVQLFPFSRKMRKVKS